MVKSSPHSFGVQVTFDDVMEVLDMKSRADASKKAIYVELLQGVYIYIYIYESSHLFLRIMC